MSAASSSTHGRSSPAASPSAASSPYQRIGHQRAREAVQRELAQAAQRPAGLGAAAVVVDPMRAEGVHPRQLGQPHLLREVEQQQRTPAPEGPVGGRHQRPRRRVRVGRGVHDGGDLRHQRGERLRRRDHAGRDEFRDRARGRAGGRSGGSGPGFGCPRGPRRSAASPAETGRAARRRRRPTPASGSSAARRATTTRARRWKPGSAASRACANRRARCSGDPGRPRRATIEATAWRSIPRARGVRPAARSAPASVSASAVRRIVRFSPRRRCRLQCWCWRASSW